MPLAAKGYRFQADFDEATQLADNADVRISGVTRRARDDARSRSSDRTRVDDRDRRRATRRSRATRRRSCARRRCSARPTSSSRPGTEASGDAARRRPAAGDAGAGRRSSSTRSCARSTSRRATTCSASCKGSARALDGPRRGPERRARQPARRSPSDAGDLLRVLDSQQRAVRRLVSRQRARCSTRSGAARASSRGSCARWRPRARHDRAPQRRAGRDRADPADDAARAAPDARRASRSCRARRGRSCATCAPPRARSGRRWPTRCRWRPSCAGCSATSTA